MDLLGVSSVSGQCPMTDKSKNSPSVAATPVDAQKAGKTRDGFARRLCLLCARKLYYGLFKIMGEATAVILGIALIWFYGMNLLLAKKTVDVSFLKRNASLWFSKAFDGKSADVGKIQLSWRPEHNAIFVSSSDIKVRGTDGMPLQSVNSLSIGMDFEDALFGRLKPVSVEIDGGSMTWRRNGKGRVVFGLGTPNSVGNFGTLKSGRQALPLDGERVPFDMAPLERLRVRGADVFVQDELRDLAVHFSHTDMELEVHGGQVSLEAEASLGDDAEFPENISASASFSPDYEDFDLILRTENVNPSKYAPSEGLFFRANRLDLPIDMVLEVSAARERGLTHVALDLASTGPGVGRFGPGTNEISSLEVNADYDPATGALLFDKFDLQGSRNSIVGQVALTNIGRPAAGFFNDDVDFNADIESLFIDATPIFDAPLSFGESAVEGRFEPQAKILTLERLKLGFPKFDIYAKIRVENLEPGGRGDVSGEVSVDGEMTAKDLLSLWPSKLVLGARRWIKRSITSGRITALDVTFDAPASALNGAPLENDQLTLNFDVHDADVKYISTMTPLTGVSGSGILRGNSFEFSTVGGKIGNLEISRGQIDMPRLFPFGGDLVIEATGRGEVPEMLSLVDQKPFQFPSRYGIVPADFGGTGDVELTIRRPLLEHFDPDRISYAVKGTLNDVKIPFSLGPHKMEKGVFKFEADKKGMMLSGPVNVGPWRSDLLWTEEFGASGERTQYRLSGKLDENTIDSFGLGFREYFGGSADVSIDARGRGLSVSTAKLDMDLTQSDLHIQDYWAKSTGIPARLSGELTLAKEGGISASNVSVSAPGLLLQGKGALAADLRLLDFDLSKVVVEGFADGRLTMRPNDEKTAFNVDMSGRFLDISSMVSQAITVKSSGVSLPINLDAQIDRLVLNEMFLLDNAQLFVRHNGVGTQEAKITGVMKDGNFTATITPSATRTGRDLRVDIPNASLASSAFLNMDSLHGGRMQLTATLPKVGGDGALQGTLKVDDFVLVQAPVMAQILSLASLKGLTDALGGAGLQFSELYVPFSYEEGKLSVRDARASGPALGLTGSGDVDFTKKTVDVDGVLVPAYSANSVLSSIPVIGEIFVGKKGEGVFALNYAVRGPFSATQVGVNPLSALTPGFLRGIFQTPRDDLPQNMESEDGGAVAPAPQDKDLKKETSEPTNVPKSDNPP